MTDQPKQGRVRGVELFQAGIRKGVRWYPKDLEESVANFRRFSSGDDKLVDPPVKIGHEEDQVKNTGVPRVGDVVDLYVDRRICEKCSGTGRFKSAPCPWCDNYDGEPTGSRTILMGDFEKVPRKIAELVERGAYNKISAEFYRVKPPEGVPAQGIVFRAASLMGGDLPQVKTLKNLLDAEWEIYTELVPQGFTVVFSESFEDDGTVACMSEVTRLKGFIKEEGKSAKEYDKLGFHKQAADEKKHKKFFQKELSKEGETMPKGTRVEKCVKDVKAKHEGVNPYAVCQASTHQNLHTGKPITHAELHSHLKGQGFMVDDDYDDGVKLHGKAKEIHERLEHGGHCCEGEGLYSHKNIGKFNVSCYDEKGESVKFGYDTLTAGIAGAGAVSGATSAPAAGSIASGVGGSMVEPGMKGGFSDTIMSDTGNTTTIIGGGTSSGHHAPAEVHHALQEHLERHGLRTSVADDNSVSIHHLHKDVHSALERSGHVHLGSKKSDIGSGETHAYRHPTYGMFHVHTLGKGMGQAVYATRGQSAMTYSEGNSQTTIATNDINPVTFSDMDMSEAYKHVSGMGLHAEPSHHYLGGKHKASLRLHSSMGEVMEKFKQHGYEHHGHGKHKHRTTGHEMHLDHDDDGHLHIVKHSEEPEMTKEEIQETIKATFSEVAGDLVKPLIEAAVSDIRKDFTPISQDVNTFKEAMKRERIEAFVETHQRPNKSGEMRVLPWEMDGSSGLPTLVDELMALDDKTPVVKFVEDGKEIPLSPLDAAMKKISLRPPRKFSEQVKSGQAGTTVQTAADQDKLEFDAFCEQAGPQVVPDRDAVWKALANMPAEQRKKQIKELNKHLKDSQVA